MNEKTKRNWLLALGVLLAVGPVAVMTVDLYLGMLLLLPGAMGAWIVVYRLREVK